MRFLAPRAGWGMWETGSRWELGPRKGETQARHLESCQGPEVGTQPPQKVLETEQSLLLCKKASLCKPDSFYDSYVLCVNFPDFLP